MANSEAYKEFKTIVRALAPYISDTYTLLDAADKVYDALHEPEETPDPWSFPYNEPPF